MAGIETRNFESPDEKRTPEKTTVELVNLAGGQIGRYTFYRITPGHDAWVVGEEPAVFVEFQGAANYAKA
jgi:hypothetical protein